MLGLLALLGIALVFLLAILSSFLVRSMTHPPRRTAGYAVARGLAVDPEERQLPYEEWELELDGGGRLPVWEIECSQKQLHKDSLTVVFVHGWAQSRIDMLARIDPWIQLCDRIVLYDRRGHGEAEDTISRLGDGEDDDLLRLLDQLGEAPIVLVGYSMGAVIALNAMAKRSGDQIIGLIAYGPYVSFHQSLQRRLKSTDYPARPVTDLALWLLRVSGIRPLDVCQADLHTIKAPIFVIHGREDQICHLDDAQRIVEWSADAQLKIVEQAGHLNAHEVDPQTHDEEIQLFIDRIVH